MDRLGLTNKKVLGILIGLAAMAFIYGLFKSRIPHLDQMPSILYCTLFIAWGLMVRRRILNVHIKQRLLIASGFMVLLFVLRVSRFNFFDEVDFMSTILWYAYYIPMTVIPLLGFLAAHYTEPVRNINRVRRAERLLIAMEVIIICVVMTNDIHNFMFKIYDMQNNDYSRNWFYYVVIAWMVLLMVGAFVVLMKKCTFSSVRKLWYIPAICLLVGYALLIWYVIEGGSPTYFGVKLFHLHEAFCFPFITSFECAIQIGLIPANTGYELLFDYSGINAAIYDNKDRAILTSKSWIQNAADADHQIRKENISGGYVTWVEDISAINRLNEELSEVTEELEEENELIRQENEVRAERVSYETKNRLYNAIAEAVKPQAIRVSELLEKDESGDISRDKLIFAAFLSAFIKRMGNLMLISDENKKISTDELGMAVKESMDYMELAGITCELMAEEPKELPAAFIKYAYDLFEQLMEDAWDSLHSCVVMFEDKAEYEITIAFDSEACSITPDWRKSELSESGGRLRIRNEDETFYVTITCEKDVANADFAGRADAENLKKTDFNETKKLGEVGA